MAIDTRAVRGFTAAEAYDRGRPGYPMAAVNMLLAELDLGTGSTVLDLAAGTGQVSRAIHDRVGLLAVEPRPEMRARFATRLPNVPVRAGEQIPVPDASIDAVVVGEAFHWFDVGAAAREISSTRARWLPRVPTRCTRSTT